MLARQRFWGVWENQLAWGPIHAPWGTWNADRISGFFFSLRVFVLKRFVWMLFVGLFPCAKTMYKLLWHSENAKMLKL